MKVYSAFSPLLLVVFLLINLTPPEESNLNFYEKGKAELEKGEWKKALNIWLKAKTGFNVEYEADPRIGFAFIDVVTGQQVPKYYDIAEEMYFWGFRNVDVNKYAGDLQKELDRLKPLMTDEQSQYLQELLNQRSMDFSAALAAFWIKQDPYPSSEYNERLLEHWERIQHARKKYTMSKNTPYGTDDRGLIYVRYGEPYEIKKRSVSINKVVDPVSGTNIDLSNNVSFQAEIWYYRNLSGKKNSSFVFGWPGKGGSGLQPGLLTLVPVAGNRIASYYDDQKIITKVANQNMGNTPQGSGFNGSERDLVVLAGHTRITREGAELMLKYAVLEEIGAMDPFYNELYNRMTRDIIKASNSGRDEKFSQTARSHLTAYEGKELSTAMLRDRNHPKTLSKTKSAIEHLQVEWQLLRFMDSKLNTIYMMATAASDFQPLIAYASKHQDSYKANDIFQLNTLYEYNKSWKLDREQPHLLPMNSSSHFGTAIYYFGDEVAKKNILFSSHFLDKNPAPNETRLHETLDTHIIASSGVQELAFPAPLELNGKESIQMSDILLAHPQEENSNLRVPFTPNLKRSFAKGDTMLVYFETYNLLKGMGYQIEYMIEGLDKKQHPKKIGHTIILNYRSKGIVSPNWFEVPLTELGDYESHRLTLHLKTEGQTRVSRSVTWKLEDGG